MANRIYINPLDRGIDPASSNIKLGQGSVRQAHNMYVPIGGGLQRMKGWGNPSLDTTEYSDAIGLMEYGEKIVRMIDTGASCTVEYLSVGSTSDIYEFPVTGDKSFKSAWVTQIVGNNDPYGPWVAQTIINPVAYSGYYSFTDYAPDGASIFPHTPQSWGTNRQGDIFLGLGAMRVQRVADVADWPAYYLSDVAGQITCAAAASDRLWVGTESGRVYYSNVANPWNWNAETGTAGYVQLDNMVTNIVDMVDGTIFLSTHSSIYILYNADDASPRKGSLELKRVSSTTGAYSDSAQLVGNDVIFYGGNGVVSLSLTQKFGNFAGSVVSEKLPELHVLLDRDVLTPVSVSSSISKNKSQYILLTNGQRYSDTNPATETIEVVDNKFYIGTMVNGENGSGFVWTTGQSPNLQSYSTGSKSSTPRIVRTEVTGIEGFYYVHNREVDYTQPDRNVVFKLFDGNEMDGEAYYSYFNTGYMVCDSPYVNKVFKKIILETNNIDADDYEVRCAFRNGVESVPNDSDDLTVFKSSNWTVASNTITYTIDEAWEEAHSYLGGNGDSISVMVTMTSHQYISTPTIESLSLVYENQEVIH